MLINNHTRKCPKSYTDSTRLFKMTDGENTKETFQCDKTCNDEWEVNQANGEVILFCQHIVKKASPKIKTTKHKSCNKYVSVVLTKSSPCSMTSTILTIKH